MCCGGRRGISAAFPPVPDPERIRTTEPPQLGERRVLIEREGTTGYLKVVFHAPAATEPDFFPMLVLDAVLTGAKGVNLWSSFRGAPPQRKARLYTALVERGLASQVAGALLPTAQPFLYTLSFTAIEGVAARAVEDAAFAEIERVRTDGVNLAEIARAQAAASRAAGLRKRQRHEHRPPAWVFRDGCRSGLTYRRCSDASRPSPAEQVWDVARRRLGPATRTVGWFRPLESR